MTSSTKTRFALRPSWVAAACATLIASVASLRAEPEALLGPTTKVYKGSSDGSSFFPSGWFPDAAFAYLWGGKDEPNTNLSWWMDRHSGSFYLDYSLWSGNWIGHGGWPSPDYRGYWIQTVYRPIDLDPNLKDQIVSLQIEQTGGWNPTWATESHRIDNKYLIGYAHIEGYASSGAQTGGWRTIYSFDNGKNWMKGPFNSYGVGTYDNRTDPTKPRMVQLGYSKIRYIADIKTGVGATGDTWADFYPGNFYGINGLVWSRYLNRWVAMYAENGSNGNLSKIVTSKDFKTYYAARAIDFGDYSIPPRAVDGAGDYPTLLGGFPYAASYPVPYNMEMGQMGYLYNKAGGGLLGRAIHFVADRDVAITWTGPTITSPVARLEQPAGTALLSGISSVDFGSLEPGASSTRTFVVRNAGNSNLSLTGSAIEGANATDFSFAPALPSLLAPKASATFTVTFTPSAAGSRAATLRLPDSDAANPLKVVLSGLEYTSADLWRLRYFGSAANSGDGADANDFDGDGFPNLVERATGFDPKSGKAFPSLQMSLNGAALDLKYTRAKAAMGEGLVYSVEWTEDLKAGPWSASGVTEVVTGEDATLQFVTATVPVGSSSRFMHLRVSSASTSVSSGAATLLAASASAAKAVGGGQTVVGVPLAASTGASAGARFSNNAYWKNTTSGTFTGLADEVPAMNFNSATGGLLNNDISDRIRLRCITFGSAAGEYVLNGNTLSMEAIITSTNPHQTFSITQNAATTATINNEVDVRTAGFYVRTAPAAGTLIFNGGVDMHGTGGIVNSGAGKIVYNGSISDSGYTDFRTGVAEYVASVNPGRFIVDCDSTGQVILNAANTFWGRTDIRVSGTLFANHSLALQNSIVTIDKNNGLVPGADLILAGLNGVGDLQLGGYSLTLGNHKPPDCYYTNYSGTISGGGSVTKVDSNRQNISKLNTYSGGTFLKGGTLQVPGNADSAFGTGGIFFDGGTLKATGEVLINRPIYIGAKGGTLDAGSNGVSLGGVISGGGAFTSLGTGTIRLLGTNTFSGSLSIQNKVVALNSAAFGTGGFTLDGGVLLLATNLNLGNAPLRVTATGSVVDTSTFTLTMGGEMEVPIGLTLAKRGSGSIVSSGGFRGVRGDLLIQGGTLAVTKSAPDVSFVQGNVGLSGAKLAFLPSATSGDVRYHLAETIGKAVNVNGAANVYLDKGANNSLTVQIGLNENPIAFNLSSTSAAIVTAAGGLATLGSPTGVRLLLPGAVDTPAGQIYSPNMVAAGPDNQADFVTYQSDKGFATFTNYTSRSGTYVQSSTVTTEIANITAPAKLSFTCYAQGLRVSGANALNLNGKTYTLTGSNGQAGVLLNSGRLEGGTLNFGSNAGFIYVGGPDAYISSSLGGSAPLTFHGRPGTKVTLGISGENQQTGGTYINGTTVCFPTSGSLGPNNHSYTLDGGGTMSFTAGNYSFSRTINIGGGGGGMDVATGANILSNWSFHGTGELHKTGPGIFRTAGDQNDLTGNIFVDEGLFWFSTAGSSDNGSGQVIVAKGASARVQTYTGMSVKRSFVLEGTGQAGEGALVTQGGGYFAQSITLAGDTLISSKAATDVFFKGPLFGQNYNLSIAADFATLIFQGGVGMGSGNLSISGPEGVQFESSSVFSSTGSVAVAAGSYLHANGAFSGFSGMTVSGLLKGQGVLTTPGTVTIMSGGDIMPGNGLAGGLATSPALLTVEGDLTLSSGSRMLSYIRNAAGADLSGADSNYGQVFVTGTGVVDGTLVLVRGSGFTPKAGNQLYVMLRNGGSGRFNQVQVVDAGITATFTAEENAVITIGGMIGKLHYNSHSSINMTDPDSGSDIVVEF